MLRQLSMPLADREKPPDRVPVVADQGDEPPACEVRATVFIACARCGQLLPAGGDRCGWCGKRAPRV